MEKTCAARQWWSNGPSKRAIDAIEIDTEGTGLVEAVVVGTDGH